MRRFLFDFDSNGYFWKVKNFLSIVLFSVLWITVGSLSNHASAATITSASYIDFDERQFGGALPDLEDFRQAPWISIRTFNSSKSPNFQSVVVAGVILADIREKEKPNQGFRNSHDRRYSLKMQIFPFHFFW